MGRHVLIQPPVAVTTTHVLSRLTNTATHSVYVAEIHLFATGGTLDQVLDVRLVTLATDGSGGTSTGLLADKDSGALDQWAGTYMVTDGTWTEPTTPVTVKRLEANMSPGFHIWQAKPSAEQRFNAGTGVRWGLYVGTAPGSSITLGSEIEFFEG